MSRFDRVPDVPVSIGPCECPGTPHGDGDLVYLAPVLSAVGGMAAQGAVSGGGTDPILFQELLWRVYRDHGITGWNLLDEKGEPVPLTTENKDRALAWDKGGEVVADKADDLYGDDVIRPFLALLTPADRKEIEALRRAARSKDGPTASSQKGTSRAPTSIKTRRKRSSTPATEADPPAA